MSIAELRVLQGELVAEINRREKQAMEDARKEIASIAASVGLTVDAIMADVRQQRRPAKIKYRHPTDAGLGWTGRGRQPVWVKEWVAAGKEIDALATAVSD